MSPTSEPPRPAGDSEPSPAAHHELPTERSPAGRTLNLGMESLSGMGTVLIFLLMILTNADIFGRFLLSAPIDGTVELVEISIVAIVFLQLGQTIRGGKLTRSTHLIEILTIRWPRVAYLLDAVFHAIGAILMVVIILKQGPRLMDAWTYGFFKGNVGIFTAPTWPLELTVLIGLIAATIQFLRVAAWHLAAALGWIRPQGPRADPHVQI